MESIDKMSSPLMWDKINHNIRRMQYQELTQKDRRELEIVTNAMLFIISEREWYPEDMEKVA